MKSKIMFNFFLIFLVLMLAHKAFASSVGGSGLPWEGPLQKLQDSITGPVAFALSITGIVLAGAALIFGGEIGGFFKSMIFLVLVIAIIISAQNMMSNLFNTGAEITAPKAQKTINKEGLKDGA